MNQKKTLPIEEHGVIGDLYTVALVGTNGSIDWCCLPNFDSAPIFGAILDSELGGEFTLQAQNPVRTNQSYLPETNILLTRFYTHDGLGELEDFMPIQVGQQKEVHEIIRRVRCIRGSVKFDLVCKPRLQFGKQKLTQTVSSPEELRYLGENGYYYGLKIPSKCSFDLASETGTLELHAGEECSLIFYCTQSSDTKTASFESSDVHESFQRTAIFWRSWLAKSRYTGRWRERVHRSALTLKLLTFQPTGAIVAAPTTSLPETLGSNRNWDYRYTWIRDASFTTYALMRLGFDSEAKQFLQWLNSRLLEAEPNADSPMQVMYTIHGEQIPSEVEYFELAGYANSRPVRFGNGAATQLQLDIYGEMIDSIYLYHRHNEPVSYEIWCHIRSLADWVAKNWHRKDEGIWEVRSGQQHFVFSKVMCWVALDRSIRMSRHTSLPAPLEEWRHARDAIYEEVMEKGWNQEIGAFTQHYDSTELDASLLLMPLVKFISATDPRMLSTVEAIKNRLSSDGLVFRYDPKASPDGFDSNEGSFTMCSFWLIECLSRSGQIEEARLLFERMLSLSNHLGLYAEQIGVHGEALGNFPQAFTHIALISAAYDLNKRLG
jgi:pentatricopeptide repeat protein